MEYGLAVDFVLRALVAHLAEGAWIKEGAGDSE